MGIAPVGNVGRELARDGVGPRHIGVAENLQRLRVMSTQERREKKRHGMAAEIRRDVPHPQTPRRVGIACGGSQ